MTHFENHWEFALVQTSSDALFCDAQSLTQMARRGDRAVLARLEVCYGDCLRAVGRSRCATCSDAEDAVQEAFANAADHLESFEARGSLHGWMNTLVSNACYRMQRGAKNALSQHVPLAPEHLTDSHVERAIAQHFQARRALVVLRELSSEQQQLFWFSAIEGWTAPELAQHFGCTPGAVRARLTRIRQHLRGRL